MSVGSPTPMAGWQRANVLAAAALDAISRGTCYSILRIAADWDFEVGVPSATTAPSLLP